MITKLVQIQDRLRNDFNKNVHLQLKVTDSLKLFIKTIQVIGYGTQFTTFKDKLKLKALMSTDSGREQLKEFLTTYKTQKNKYENYSFESEVKATQSDLMIEVEKNSSKEIIQISSETETKYIDSSAMNAGALV